MDARARAPHTLTAHGLDRSAVHIRPGGWTVQTETPISTLLGSCVSVCLIDPRLNLGGMNHFLLPSRRGCLQQEQDTILAGDHAMEVLRNAMYARGASAQRLVAKAFGGGNIVTSLGMAIGERNIEFACAWLKREGIPLVASDFGGSWSRRIVFNPLSGEVFCRRNSISPPRLQELAHAEAELERNMTNQAPATRVELFS